MNENTRDDNLIIWTVPTFAKNLGISLPTAYKLTEEPEFPLLRLGRKKLVRVSGLERWMIERSANRVRGQLGTERKTEVENGK